MAGGREECHSPRAWAASQTRKKRLQAPTAVVHQGTGRPVKVKCTALVGRGQATMQEAQPVQSMGLGLAVRGISMGQAVRQRPQPVQPSASRTREVGPILAKSPSKAP